MSLYILVSEQFIVWPNNLVLYRILYERQFKKLAFHSNFIFLYCILIDSLCQLLQDTSLRK